MHDLLIQNGRIVDGTGRAHRLSRNGGDGEVTRENDQDTGARPGRLIRRR
jgi:N-acyl-D-aspartate/D-glutamate deacylase